jgi:hypothetical protein
MARVISTSKNYGFRKVIRVVLDDSVASANQITREFIWSGDDLQKVVGDSLVDKTDADLLAEIRAILDAPVTNTSLSLDGTTV